jgi:hypothetical protein
MYKVIGSEALAVARANPKRAWDAKRFVADEYFQVALQPKFKIGRDTPIFTMGSCFAREVENQLLKSGIPLVTQQHGVEPQHFESYDETTGSGGGVKRGQRSRGFLNKYTIASMTHEIRRVLLGEEYPYDGLIELGPDRWFDPNAAGLRVAPLEIARELRAHAADATSQIRKAQIAFLTLGLVEGWVDRVTGLALNRAPGGRDMIRLADRFELSVPSYSESLAELENCITLVRKVCNPEMRFIITVSPVPFHATFRPLDVVVANTLSKSLLRTIADEVSSRYEYVDYFPSYELVTNSPPSMAWAEDRLHVQHQMSCTRFPWTPICRREDRNDEVEHERDRFF